MFKYIYIKEGKTSKLCVHTKQTQSVPKLPPVGPLFGLATLLLGFTLTLSRGMLKADAHT